MTRLRSSRSWPEETVWQAGLLRSRAFHPDRGILAMTVPTSLIPAAQAPGWLARLRDSARRPANGTGAGASDAPVPSGLPFNLTACGLKHYNFLRRLSRHPASGYGGRRWLTPDGRVAIVTAKWNVERPTVFEPRAPGRDGIDLWSVAAETDARRVPREWRRSRNWRRQEPDLHPQHDWGKWSARRARVGGGVRRLTVPQQRQGFLRDGVIISLLRRSP